MSTRYFIFLSYRGDAYHGWQVQPNGITVQQVLDEALSVVLGEKISTTGAGRTDTGVHARFFCAHFDSLKEDLDSGKNTVYRLNRFLPPDISVSSIRKVKPDANARFSALSRTYKYFISRTKDPFSQGSSWYIHGNLDIGSMNKAAEVLKEYTDFTSFARLHTDNKTNICHIKEAYWEETGNMLVFTIKADRFLRNMVRAIVGTMSDIGRGKIDTYKFRQIIEAMNRSESGRSAPAEGLYLTAIEYPEEIFL